MRERDFWVWGLGLILLTAACMAIPSCSTSTEPYRPPHQPSALPHSTVLYSGEVDYLDTNGDIPMNLDLEVRWVVDSVPFVTRMEGETADFSLRMTSRPFLADGHSDVVWSLDGESRGGWVEVEELDMDHASGLFAVEDPEGAVEGGAEFDLEPE